MTKRGVFGFLIAIALSGCVGISMHSMHPMRIAVTEMSSAAAIPNASFSVEYDYDSYGWFYLFNTPHDITTVTDSQGIAIVDIADFRYRILLKINGKLTSIDKQLVHEGGVVSISPYKVILRPVVSDKRPN